jgi:hypothetical protein
MCSSEAFPVQNNMEQGGTWTSLLHLPFTLERVIVNV